MATRISHSPAETEALGEAWGRAAVRGLVIGLTGMFALDVLSGLIQQFPGSVALGDRQGF